MGLFGLAVCFGLIFGINDILKHVPLFLVWFGLAFVCWGMLIIGVLYRPKPDLKIPLLIVSIIIVLLWLMPTTLSTDVYTYLWDGETLVSGFNPYLHKPSDAVFDVRHSSDLYQKIYWKGEYTVYPPLAELVFSIGHYFYQWFGLVGAKIWLSLPTIVLAGLLFKVLDRRYWLVFVTNPLLLFESFNGGHIDVWMMLFGWLAYWSYLRKHYYISAGWLGLATAVKIIPIVFLPIIAIDLVKSKRWRDGVVYSLLVGLILLVFYLPFISVSLFPVFRYVTYSDVNEFNASVYRYLHFLGGIWSVLTHQNIKIILAVGLILGVVVVAMRKFSVNSLVLAGIIFLILNSVVYPWYLLFLLPLIFWTIEKSRANYWFIELWVVELFLAMTYFDQISTSLISYEQKKEIVYKLSMIGYGVILLVACGLVWYNRKNMRLK